MGKQIIFADLYSVDRPPAGGERMSTIAASPEEARGFLQRSYNFTITMAMIQRWNQQNKAWENVCGR